MKAICGMSWARDVPAVGHVLWFVLHAIVTGYLMIFPWIWNQVGEGGSGIAVCFEIMPWLPVGIILDKAVQIDLSIDGCINNNHLPAFLVDQAVLAAEGALRIVQLR